MTIQKEFILSPGTYYIGDPVSLFVNEDHWSTLEIFILNSSPDSVYEVMTSSEIDYIKNNWYPIYQALDQSHYILFHDQEPIWGAKTYEALHEKHPVLGGWFTTKLITKSHQILYELLSTSSGFLCITPYTEQKKQYLKLNRHMGSNSFKITRDTEFLVQFNEPGILVFDDIIVDTTPSSARPQL